MGEQVHRLSVGHVPGPSVGLVGPRAMALVDDDPRSALVKSLWTVIASGGDFRASTEVLVSTGLTHLPSLVIVQFDGDGLRALVRGEMALSVRAPGGGADQVLQAVDVTTWVEHVEPVVERVSVHRSGDLAEMGPFEVSCGIFPAARLELDRSPIGAGSSTKLGSADHEPATVPLVAVPDEAVDDEDERHSPDGPASSDADGAVPGPEDQVDDGEESEPRHEPDAIGAPLPEHEPPVPPEGAAILPGDGADEAPRHGDGQHGSSNATVRFDEGAFGGDDDSAEAAADEMGFDEPADGSRPAEDEPAPSTDGDGPVVSDEPEPDPGDDFDHLFGATQFRPISSAGRSEPDDELGTGGSGGGGTDRHGPVIDEVPVPNAAAAESADLGDHDGMTISLAQLRAAQAAGSAEAPRSGLAPSTMVSTVHAVLCQAGHYNPPSATSCRVCAIEIPEQAHVSVPRPVLGTFRFSSGEERPVTRPMLLGRSPKAFGQLGGELPELVSLSSPTKELSGTHLEVRVEGWQILVVDRQSTNGTTVRLPHREPQRLHPGEPFPIVPGTVVDMADEVQFTYEVGA